MASMDACIKFLKEQGQERFAAMRGYFESFCEKAARLKHIRIAKCDECVTKGT